jgi:Zn-dependent membrane protease YugP
MEYALYFLFLLAIVIAMVSQVRVSTMFHRYSRVQTASGRRAEEIALEMLRSAGLYDVRVERVSGHLTDHYDPAARVLRLSDGVYGERTAAAIGVAAHEAGHAIQHAEGYAPLRFRTSLVPIASFASNASWILILIGSLIMSFVGLFGGIGYYLMLAGIGLFSMTTLFQLVTLPCEFDASRRALASMERMCYFSPRELSDSKKVLSAAAMTYVASLLVSILQLLRLLLLIRRNDR